MRTVSTLSIATALLLSGFTNIEAGTAVREASKKYISILKTGQTKSYVDYDDGYYQKRGIGKKHTYTRDGSKNIVTDRVTTLMWQDDKNVIDKKPWAEGMAYCENLNMGGYSDWRMPDIMEIGTIVNFGIAKPGIDTVFKNFFESYHWSSTADGIEPSKVHVQSYTRRYIHDVSRTLRKYTRCVRGEDENLSGGFVRDDKNEIVEHKTTGLMWQDNTDAATVTKNWKDSIGYCKNISLGGYVDWRLPNRNELHSIMDYSKNISPTINSKFINTAVEKYWSSTTYYDNSTSVYMGGFIDGDLYPYLKINTSHIRCVRNK